MDKTCSKCGVTKPADDFYLRRRDDPAMGRQTICKECTKSKTREWHANNRDRHAEYCRNRYAKDPDAARAYGAEWRAKNPDKRRASSRKYYEKNKEKLRQAASEWGKKNRTRLTQLAYERRYRKGYAWLHELKAKPCMDCGGTFPPECMDLDHRPGEVKSFSISTNMQRPREELEAEIAKCDLVCANCHRIRTKKRLHEKREAGRNFVRQDTRKY